MRLATFRLQPVACAAALWLTLGLAASARADDTAAEAARPAVAKPAVAPATRSLAPFKAKPAAQAEAVPAPPGDEGLRTMLIERLAGSGELVLKTSEVVVRPPAKARRGTADAVDRVSAHRATAEAAALAAAYRAAKAAERLPHWAYAGPGAPEQWADLRADFATCAGGLRQSPIDIRDGIGVQLEPVRFDYQASGFRVLDTGHTIQVSVAPGNTIEVLGRRYELVQFHFHRPSEERVNGRSFDMVVHLVHKDVEGRLAVVAVLLTRGAAQPVIQAVWNNLPLERGEDLAAPVALDPAALLPEDRRYFTYMGSLTMPPCSEGVLWMVMKTPVQVSSEQIAIFSRLYPMNARPVQPLNARLIKESN
jgi:carbonic anhydrase